MNINETVRVWASREAYANNDDPSFIIDVDWNMPRPLYDEFLDIMSRAGLFWVIFDPSSAFYTFRNREGQTWQSPSPPTRWQATSWNV